MMDGWMGYQSLSLKISLEKRGCPIFGPIR